MQKTLLIAIGQIIEVTAGLSAVTAYWAKSGEQSVVAAEIEAGASAKFGPYVQTATLDVVSERDFTATAVENVGPVPRALTASDIGAEPASEPAEAVADATTPEDAVTQLNALLASLRAAGILAEAE
ncbi:MAG TPA: hypothetical protein PK205_07170 [Promineifilum sp.]|nr:hypothetical protein [Promineifilum sp.]